MGNPGAGFAGALARRSAYDQQQYDQKHADGLTPAGIAPAISQGRPSDHNAPRLHIDPTQTNLPPIVASVANNCVLGQKVNTDPVPNGGADFFVWTDLYFPVATAAITMAQFTAGATTTLPVSYTAPLWLTTALGAYAAYQLDVAYLPSHTTLISGVRIQTSEAGSQAPLAASLSLAEQERTPYGTTNTNPLPLGPFIRPQDFQSNIIEVGLRFVSSLFHWPTFISQQNVSGSTVTLNFLFTIARRVDLAKAIHPTGQMGSFVAPLAVGR